MEVIYLKKERDFRKNSKRLFRGFLKKVNEPEKYPVILAYNAGRYGYFYFQDGEPSIEQFINSYLPDIFEKLYGQR